MLGFQGIDENRVNQVGRKLPEISNNAPHDLPTNLRLFSHQQGSIMGEEDMFNDNHPYYTGTLKCTSQIGKVYKISREHFSSIKTQPGSYLVLVN